MVNFRRPLRYDGGRTHEYGRNEPTLHSRRPAGHAGRGSLRTGQRRTGGAKHGMAIQPDRHSSGPPSLRPLRFTHGLGWVAGADAGYQCYPGTPGMVRKPDASFVRSERLPRKTNRKATVVSPRTWSSRWFRRTTCTTKSRTRSRSTWGRASEWSGSSIRRRTLFASTESMGREALLHEADELSGEDVVPGFRCRVGAPFAIPTAPATPS